jgi:hypothetical protein
MKPIVLLIALAIIRALTGCTMVNTDEDRDFHETARVWLASRYTKTVTVK